MTGEGNPWKEPSPLGLAQESPRQATRARSHSPLLWEPRPEQGPAGVWGSSRRGTQAGPAGVADSSILVLEKKLGAQFA